MASALRILLSKTTRDMYELVLSLLNNIALAWESDLSCLPTGQKRYPSMKSKVKIIRQERKDRERGRKREAEREKIPRGKSYRKYFD